MVVSASPDDDSVHPNHSVVSLNIFPGMTPQLVTHPHLTRSLSEKRMILEKDTFDITYPPKCTIHPFPDYLCYR